MKILLLKSRWLQTLFSKLAQKIEQGWWLHGPFRPYWLLFLLRPLSWCFLSLVTLRRFLYQNKILPVHFFPVPVIVVGNITVGGGGKTPCVIALVKWLQAQGLNPGIVSRGYGGLEEGPQLVLKTTTVAQVGDEALLLYQQLKVPIVVARQRTTAVDYLLEQHPECNVVVSDDGLQHYALARDLEIAMFNAERGIGNGRYLPLGPLRESLTRLVSVDWVLVHQLWLNAKDLEGDDLDSDANHNQNSAIPLKQKLQQLDLRHQPYSLSVKLAGFYRIQDDQPIALQQLQQVESCYAVAAIAYPKGFFNILMQLGIKIQSRAYADHYNFTAADFKLSEPHAVILMTEKDAVKCRHFATKTWYYLRISMQLPQQMQTELRDCLTALGVKLLTTP